MKWFFSTSNETRERRFYVTMTWDDWPEGGSFGTVVNAETAEEAEVSCRIEMAMSRATESGLHDKDVIEQMFAEYGDHWHLVDCFDLDDFIAQHKRK